MHFSINTTLVNYAELQREVRQYVLRTALSRITRRQCVGFTNSIPRTSTKGEKFFNALFALDTSISQLLACGSRKAHR